MQRNVFENAVAHTTLLLDMKMQDALATDTAVERADRLLWLRENIDDAFNRHYSWQQRTGRLVAVTGLALGGAFISAGILRTGDPDLVTTLLATACSVTGLSRGVALVHAPNPIIDAPYVTMAEKCALEISAIDMNDFARTPYAIHRSGHGLINTWLKGEEGLRRIFARAAGNENRRSAIDTEYDRTVNAARHILAPKSPTPP
jgi:hypothetical protein